MTLLLKIATIDLVKAKQLDFIEHIFIVHSLCKAGATIYVMESMVKHEQDH